MNNVYAFDRGIIAWANKYPGRSVLLGKHPLDVRKLLPDNYFESRNLEPQEFLEKSGKAVKHGAFVIDIRGPAQRKVSPTLKTARSIETDKFVKLIGTGFFKNEELFILDQTGEQVRWLQYHLEASHFTKYYFLKGGMQQFD